jgi:NTP pyrophosphatase (non-canonical NTP hydrolase)
MSDKDLTANCALGLTGEAGELADYLKKVLYHGHEIQRGKVQDELGDLLWYVAAVASIYELSLDVIAQCNIAKLTVRYPNGFSREDSRRRRDV